MKSPDHRQWRTDFERWKAGLLDLARENPALTGATKSGFRLIYKRQFPGMDIFFPAGWNALACIDWAKERGFWKG